MVVTPGQVVAVQAADPAACPVPYLGTNIYGKLVIDSVRTSPTRVYFRSTVDPNCDFRSLLPGVPKDSADFEVSYSPLPAWTLAATWRYVGEYAIDAPNLLFSESYDTIDASVSYRS